VVVVSDMRLGSPLSRVGWVIVKKRRPGTYWGLSSEVDADIGAYV